MRYIDDCLCVWPHGGDALTEYFEYINTVHPTIKFTIDRTDSADITGQLPFLDTLISVAPNGHFTTELYRVARKNVPNFERRLKAHLLR